MSWREKKLISYNYSTHLNKLNLLRATTIYVQQPIMYSAMYDPSLWLWESSCTMLYMSSSSSFASAIYFQSAGLHPTRRFLSTGWDLIRLRLPTQPAHSSIRIIKDNAKNKGSPYSRHNTRDSAVHATTNVESKGGFRLLAPQQASIHLRIMSPYYNLDELHSSMSISISPLLYSIQITWNVWSEDFQKMKNYIYI